MVLWREFLFFRAMKLPTRLKSKTLLWIPLLSGITISIMWACGPWFPDWLLTQGDLELIKPPTTHFQNEVKNQAHAVPSPYKTVPPETTKQKQTLSKAIEDLRTALIERSLPQSEIENILQQHQTSRKAIQSYREDFERYDAVRNYPWLLEDTKAPSFSPPSITEGLPLEFAIYFRGAIAYHRKLQHQARKAWEEVLSLPEEQRTFRSTWAAFMLGRLDVDLHPELAITRFQQVRSLVDQGFKDSLGLGAASLGWEARAWFRQKQYSKAIDLYLEQIASGEPHTGHTSIRWVLDQALREIPDSFKDLATTPTLRRIVTAYLASNHFVPWDWDEQEDVAVLEAWLQAVDESNAPEDSLFEPLALAVYQRGLYDLSEQLLERAPNDGILRAWLKSKLLFRNGNIEEATQWLAKVSTHFPSWEELEARSSKGQPILQDDSSQSDFVYRTALAEQSRKPTGEWGILLLHRGEFIQSLDTLLNAGYWMDAAYVAERVLTIKELKEYVDQHWPAKEEPNVEDDFNPDFPPSAWSKWAWDNATYLEIRYLLARRLAREERNEEASPYYPHYWGKQFNRRIELLKTGYDAAQEKDTRAQALWEAAKITRYSGLELIGTELDPDWAIHEGNFEIGVTKEARLSPDNTTLSPTQLEIKRVDDSRLKPYERFHYRYLAADIAWDALNLMPDNNPQTARNYCEAGGWLKGRDPKAADRFYKALVRRCPETEIGKAADNSRWFPSLDENGNIQKKEKQLNEEPPGQGTFHSL